MKQFRVVSAQNRRAVAKAGPLEARSAGEISLLLPAGHYSTIAEVGSGTCSLAAHFFTGNPPAHYRCFESARELLPAITPPAGVRAEQFSVSAFEPANGIPLPAASQDVFVACHYLEYLRMDELYMVCHEARRTVKPGGRWAIASLTLPDNAFFGFWQKLRHPGQALDLHHYISPEDWRVIAERRYRVNGCAAQTVLLERLP
jgi:hypothetical protein